MCYDALEYSGDFLDGAAGDGREKFTAVRFGEDTAVENGDDAGVGVVADEASDALTEFEHRFGDADLVKRASSFLLYRFVFGLEQWLVGMGKREFGDDHIAESFARDIHAGPKTVCAEDHGADIFFELLEHLVAGEFVTLDHELDFVAVEEGGQGSGSRAHGIVAGEEDEGFAAAHFEKSFDFLAACFVELGSRFWVGHVAHDIDAHLFFEVEGGVERENRDIGGTETGGDIWPFTDAQGGAGKDGGLAGAKEARAQVAGYIERGAAQGDAGKVVFLGFAPLEPIDETVAGGLEKVGYFEARGIGFEGEAGEFHAGGGLVVVFSDVRANGTVEISDFDGERIIVNVEGFAEAHLGFILESDSLVHRGEKGLGAFDDVAAFLEEAASGGGLFA